MLYIKIGKKKYPCKIQAFTTQGGNEGIRVISDAPKAKSGFLIVDDDDNVVYDRTQYTNLYYDGGDFKEYTIASEDTIPARCYANGTPANPYDVLSRRISAVNNRVTDITPYESTKTAYYGENEKVFYGVPNGVLSVTFDKYDGEYDISRIEDRVTVSFPRLGDATNITLIVQ